VLFHAQVSTIDFAKTNPRGWMLAEFAKFCAGQASQLKLSRFLTIDKLKDVQPIRHNDQPVLQIITKITQELQSFSQ
jgi:hypothetical protein